MKIIVPMAGRGSRLRPHTLTVPKPLIPVAGKPIVQRLVEDLAKSFEGGIEEIAFIIGDFGAEVERDLLRIAESLGAKGSIYFQDQPLGTAHAILCAKESLGGPCIVAFADTLFRADFKIDTAQDGVIWVQQVEDPRAYGVIKMDEAGYITDFVEKPQHFVSDLAIIGIYYIKDGDTLRDELQYLIDNDIKDKGEYQLTNALENMKTKGLKFRPGPIDEWLDCGNKDAVIYSNMRVLEMNKHENWVSDTVRLENAVIIPPCFVGENVLLRNAVVGPHVSIGANTRIEDAVIRNSVIQADSLVRDALLSDSMIGNKVDYQGRKSDISIGDYTNYKA